MRSLPLSSRFRTLALASWMFVSPVTAVAETAEPGPTTRPADRALLEALAAEQRVVAQMPDPGIAQYLQETAIRLAARLGEWARGWFGHLAVYAGAGGQWFLSIFFLAFSGLTVLLLGRALASRRKRRRAKVPVVLRAAAEEETGWSNHRWEAELRRRIEEGAGAEAATALWWWLASRLVPTGVDGAWTSRELLETADRRELRPGLRSLDRLLYGALEPVVEEVAKLWGELREALG